MKRTQRLFFVWLCLCATLLFSVSAQQPAQPIEQLLRNSQRFINNERYEAAYEAATQALQLSRQQNDKLHEGRAINLLAIAAFHTNRIGEAIRYFKQVSLTAEETGFARIQSSALVRAGAMLRLTGRYEDALYCLQNALRLARQYQLKNLEVLALSHLGMLYAETADYAKAETLLNEALPLARQLADSEPRATLLMRLGFVAKERGDFAAALQYCEQAEALLAGRPRKLRDIEIVYRLATIYATLEQWPKAKARYEQALQLCRELHAPQFTAIALGNYAGLHFKMGAYTAAFDSALQAVALLRRGGGSKHLEAQFLATCAEALRALGRQEEALTSYRQALAALEQARALSIPTETSRAGIVATRHQVFAGAIDLLLNLSRTEEAFDVAESYHARAFLDVLAESALDAPADLKPEQQAQEDTLFEHIAAVQKKLWQTDTSAEQEEALQRELTDAERALEMFRLEQRRADPRYATVKAPPTISQARAAALLGKDTALLEFVLGEERSFAWLLLGGKLTAVTLPPRKVLEPLITGFRTTAAAKVNSTTATQAITKLKTQSQPLYDKLIHPLEPHLIGAHKLIIVPDGALAYLPFETLAFEPLAGKTPRASYLLERFAISYAPSASALAALRALNPNANTAQGVIAFGDPLYANTAAEPAHERGGPELRQLPYTRNEVNAIAALFPESQRRVLLGAEAHEANVKAAPLGQYRYVHFATHALVDETHPARSAIILSTPTTDDDKKEDGALQLAEVMRLKLNADLVTLSACRTGLGQLLYGEGIIGLTRAFLYAGADSVVVSLWNVNDIATASLMKAFYKNLQQGMNKDEALRQAKLELLRGQQPAWRHPYYWAPFVLVGVAQK